MVAAREIGAADRPWNSTSPTIASFDGAWWKITCPGVWPGV